MNTSEPERITLSERDFEAFDAAINRPFTPNAALTGAIASAKSVLRTPAAMEAEVVLELAAQCAARLSRLAAATADVREAEAFIDERNVLIRERFKIDVKDTEQLALLKGTYSQRAGELRALEEALK